MAVNTEEMPHMGGQEIQEPIAVVGLGCRLAGGVNSANEFWRLLMDGREAISEIPPERWADHLAGGPQVAAALRRTTRWGGFLDEIDTFDADFFGVLPREAEVMDPQQRILLEVAWEALEHAGITPASLAGSDTGVFVGVGSDDYGRRLLEDLPRIEAWTGIGASMCAVANRISYTLDLRGPSLAVDTACSASLVATHLAVAALRSGEVPLALVGGVNVMAGPGLTMVLDAAGAISPDGRCKSFDAAANGYGRGEGAGVVVLKRQSDAERDGDRILALIRGSAVHQDGRTNGIMAPSGPAQAHLLRQAYDDAGVDPASVQYVEAHGTGTRAGDPIEASALAAVLGSARPAGDPLLIGSVKSNIGHLEAGSGVAGVIKAVLALAYRQLPPSLNLTEPNPRIPWQTANLAVVTEPSAWPETAGPRRAGVSGYGYGGTIAHVVLEEAPAGAPSPGADGGRELANLQVFPVSAASEPALRAHATATADWLEGDGHGSSLVAVGSTLGSRRTHHAHRAGVVARDHAGVVAGLRALADDRDDPALATGVALADPGPGPVWVFSGHGSQWSGMGRELLDAEPAFAAAIDRIGPVFAEEIGFTPRDVLVSGDLTAVDVIQPMIFAMQVGLAETWREHGVRPAAVIGHSVGEIAAAVTAGMIGLTDGARLICRRSLLLRQVAGQGAMAMVGLPFDEVADQLAGRADVVAAIAAAPSSTVVAGDVAAVAQVARAWETAGLMVRMVASDVAFHSPHMDPLTAQLAAAFDGLTADPPDLPVYSTALADPRSTAARDGAYWAANLRSPVRFAAAVAAAAADGYRAFVELSSHPVVAHSISETLADEGFGDGVFVGHSLRRHKPEQATLMANAAALSCAAGAVDFGAVFAGRQLADLPTIAWNHRRFWRPSVGAGRALQHDLDSHTLLGGRTTVTGTTPLTLWQTFLDSSSRPYPGDHPVQGVEIIPAAVLLNTFTTAAADGLARTGPVLPTLTDVTLRTPVSVAAPRELQVCAQDGTLRISSRLADDDADGGAESAETWLTHTTAGVEAAGDLPHVPLDVQALRARCPRTLPNEFVVDRLADIGVAAMGFPWQIEELRTLDGRELIATVWAGDVDTSLPSANRVSVLDAALSIGSVVFDGPPVLRMPARIRRVEVATDLPDRVAIHVRVTDGESARDTVDVVVTDLAGRTVARLSQLRYGVLDGDPGATVSPRRLVHEIAWRERPGGDQAEGGELPDVVLLVAAEDEPARALEYALRLRGVEVARTASADGLEPFRDRLRGRGAVLVVPGAPGTHATGADEVQAAWLVAAAARRLAGWRAGAREGTPSPRLWVLTSGVRDGVLGHSSTWGVGRIVAGEHPEIWGGVIDVGTDAGRLAAVDLDRLAAVLADRPGDDIVHIAGGSAAVPRLVPAEGRPVRGPVACRADGTYLITGGLGALGLAVADWLAGRGARRIVLAGRHALPSRALWDDVTDPRVRAQITAVRELEALGVTVVTVALDIADAEQASRVLDPAALGLPPFAGVVHAAGVLDNRLLTELDEGSLQAVLRPKVDGALVLDRLFPAGSVDFFVLFSSCGYLLGLPGQASYGAANAVLDALAARRRSGGHTDTISFGWTSWHGLGMSTSSALIDMELEARGTADISAQEAFRAWEFAQRDGGGYYAVLRMIPLAVGERIPLLGEIIVAEAETGADLAARDWTALEPAELAAALVEQVRVEVASEIKLDPDELDLNRPLLEMGLDSVMTTVIRLRLERLFRVSLPATLLWTKPTVATVAGFIGELLTAGAQDAADAAQSPSAQSPSASEVALA
jgi:6-methylsalicylic acid synthase